ncbi:hypothetical protein ACJ73_08116 [Blastomyces percursus]|uniref:Uncharacterized protein n=1 Tax=Blastomyces percursus TaxID=1658174 RepID=A0A1J9QZ17_9EURO|nr:hypothetical protein ACJ73_08116 [Blastomyces percursus]
MYYLGIGRRAADLSMHEILYGRKIDEMDSGTDSMETEDDDIYLHARLGHVEPNVPGRMH